MENIRRRGEERRTRSSPVTRSAAETETARPIVFLDHDAGRREGQALHVLDGAGAPDSSTPPPLLGKALDSGEEWHMSLGT